MTARGKGGAVAICVAAACAVVGIRVAVWAAPKLAAANLRWAGTRARADNRGGAPRQPNRLNLPAPSPAGAALAPDALFSQAAPAVALVEVRGAQNQRLGIGSGFFVSADGLLVTNFHVIEPAVYADVRTADGQTLLVEGTVSLDPGADLALLKVRGADLPFLAVSDGPVPPTGTRVFAIGNPQGLSNTLSDGLVSGVRLDRGITVIQTTAAISPGSSGGPLLTADGVVVGVTTFQSSSGQNLNFAVPAEQVHALMDARTRVRKLGGMKSLRPTLPDADALSEALACIMRGDVRRTAELLRGVEDRQQRNPLFWFVTGCLHQRLANLPLAIEAFKQATRLKPDYADAYDRLADIFIGQKKYPEAIDAFRGLARARPFDTRPYHRAAHVYSWQGDHAQALVLLDKALAIDPDDASAHAEKAMCLLSLKRYDEAVASAEAALGVDARLWLAHMVLGQTRLQQKRPLEAAAVLREALKLAPDSPEVYFLLGEACHQSGDATSAVAAWRNAVRFGRNTAAGKDARKRLTEMGKAS